MEKKRFTAEEFLKPKFDLSKVCGGCRFFKITLDECIEKGISVEYETPKCDKFKVFCLMKVNCCECTL